MNACNSVAILGNPFSKKKDMGSCTSSDEPPKTKAKPEVNEKDKATLQLKVARDNLIKQKRKLDAQLEKQTALVKECLRAKKKDRALLLLKRKKLFEKQYEVASGELENVKTLLSEMEFATIQQQVMKSLSNGNNVLKEMERQLSLEDAQRIMDETAEGMAYAEELADIVAGNLSQEDDQDIENELMALAEEASPHDVATDPAVSDPTTTGVPDMPQVPKVPDMPEIPAGLAGQPAVAAEADTKQKEKELDDAMLI